MAPHDFGTCGASVASSSSSVRSSSRRSLRGAARDAPAPSPSTSAAPTNDENQDCGNNEAAGQRRRNRALKLRQTRNRNAARPQPQSYTSAEDSDDEEEDVKPDISSLCGEAMAPGTDKQAWKKQQRMIRNRESAALSRKRKRDRIEFLEQQVAGLVDENRGLKHRLAKYEASPQQARYKYARQTAASSAAPRPGPVNGDGMKQDWPTAEPNAMGRKRQTGGGGAGVPFDGRNNGHGHGNGKPVGCYNSRESAVETTAHGLSAAIADTITDRRRTSLRQSARRPTTARSHSGSSTAPTAPSLGGLPPGLPPSSPAPDSSRQQQASSPFSYSARLAVTTPGTAPPPASPLALRSLVLPSLRAVKVELSSCSSDYDDDDDDERIAGAAPAVVLDGYSSCSTLEDLSSAAEHQDCSSSSVKEVGTLPQGQQHHQMVTAFDRDDDAACDNLLLDILSGDGQGQGGDDDGFFSLLADDMIVDPSSCTGSEAGPEPLQGLNCFVKEETRF